MSQFLAMSRRERIARLMARRPQSHGDGEANQTVAPDGTRTRWENDRLGRMVRLEEGLEWSKVGSAGLRCAPAPACSEVQAGSLHHHSRITHYAPAPDGGLSRLIVSNPGTGDQVTEWLYGTTLETDGVARSDLLKAKLYPLDLNATGQVLRQTTYNYNRQGQLIGNKDANNTGHAYVLDKLGRVLHDRAIALENGVRVQKIDKLNP